MGVRRPALPPFSSLLEAHAEGLYRFLVSAAGAQEADDCFQETVLQALRAYPRLRHARNLRGWLFTIAHSRAMDSHRARARAPLPVGAAPEREAPGSAGDGLLWKLVRTLPLGQRRALELRFAGELSYLEIAAVLGCSAAAARRRVSDGVARLRKEVPA